MSKLLCWMTRAAYVVVPTVTLCVLHDSVNPVASTQSNTTSGVSVTGCSFRLKLLCNVPPITRSFPTRFPALGQLRSLSGHTTPTPHPPTPTPPLYQSFP